MTGIDDIVRLIPREEIERSSGLVMDILVLYIGCASPVIDILTLHNSYVAQSLSAVAATVVLLLGPRKIPSEDLRHLLSD